MRYDAKCFALLTVLMLGGAAHAQQPARQPAPPQPPKFDQELELQFNGHCRECHSFVKNDNRLGPSLYGVVGRKAGIVPGFNYSDSIKGSNTVWDEKTLDQWITNPGAVIPGNNMAALFGGIDDPAIRAKIIAFLKQDAPSGEASNQKK
jgi:cytochrome c